MGLEQPIPPVSTPFLPGRDGKARGGEGVSQNVASNQLKIEQRVAYS